MKDRDIQGRFLKGRIRPEQERIRSGFAHLGKPSGMLGKKHSEEWKLARSIAQTGKPHLSKEGKERLRLFNLGNEYNLGKHLSEETKQKIREKAELRVRDKASNWQGGISENPYGIEFNKQLKEKIRKRDGFRCQQCFREQDELRTETNRKRKLNVHHIDFNKENNNPSNLIALCQRCHMQTNYNRDGWINYFQNEMEIRGLK